MWIGFGLCCFDLLGYLCLFVVIDGVYFLCGVDVFGFGLGLVLDGVGYVVLVVGIGDGRFVVGVWLVIWCCGGVCGYYVVGICDGDFYVWFL